MLVLDWNRCWFRSETMLVLAGTRVSSSLELVNMIKEREKNSRKGTEIYAGFADCAPNSAPLCLREMKKEGKVKREK